MTQEKSAIFTKILNYSSSSHKMFCAKMSRYFHYTYFLQKKSVIPTNIWNYTNFLCIMLCAKMFRYFHYSYTATKKKSTIFLIILSYTNFSWINVFVKLSQNPNSAKFVTKPNSCHYLPQIIYFRLNLYYSH